MKDLDRIMVMNTPSGEVLSTLKQVVKSENPDDIPEEYLRGCVKNLVLFLELAISKIENNEQDYLLRQLEPLCLAYSNTDPKRPDIMMMFADNINTINNRLWEMRDNKTND